MSVNGIVRATENEALAVAVAELMKHIELNCCSTNRGVSDAHLGTPKARVVNRYVDYRWATEHADS